MFAYCGNKPVMHIDSCGNRSAGTWSFKSDEVGRELLLHYLFGDGEEFPATEKHSDYLMKNEQLTDQVSTYVFDHTPYLLPGETAIIDISIHVEIENGESIIGYQYLHGTNAEVGDFQIKGTVTRTHDDHIIYNLTYTWNDIMDPNMTYDSDRLKAKIAKLLSFGKAQSYPLKITWSDVSTAPYSYNPRNVRGEGWLFS